MRSAYCYPTTHISSGIPGWELLVSNFPVKRGEAIFGRLLSVCAHSRLSVDNYFSSLIHYMRLGTLIALGVTASRKTGENNFHIDWSS
jgi:hypothetical protein